MKRITIVNGHGNKYHAIVKSDGILTRRQINKLNGMCSHKYCACVDKAYIEHDMYQMQPSDTLKIVDYSDIDTSGIFDTLRVVEVRKSR